MSIKNVAFILLGLIFSQYSFGQNEKIITTKKFPQGYFRYPLNIPADASGTYGELRSNHFHGGDDYRTQQKIGLPVYAVADGFVSRIFIQASGGGNILYIDHPNGFSSVYMHLDRFNPLLTEILRTEQYKQQKFGVDLTLSDNKIPIKKGDLIAYAGNTGGSGGPHLHLEIRETESQRSRNPQLFGLKFTDNYPPSIHGIMIYDLNEPIFNENTVRRSQNVQAISNTNFALQTKEPILVNGKFALGINTNDKHRAGGFSNGIYSIELYIDGQPVSIVLFEELDLKISRSINSYIDYPYFKKTKTRIQKSFKDPGNPSQIFYHLDNNGIIELKDNNIHDVKYVVKDAHGNTSELDFQIQNDANYMPTVNRLIGNQLLKHNQNNNFETNDIRIKIPEGTLFNDLDFVYNKTDQQINRYSSTHHVHNNLTPILGTYNLSIKAVNLPEYLESKALITSPETGAEGGEFQNGWVTVNTRNFGSFYITVDTIAPSIKPKSRPKGKNKNLIHKIEYTISDNASGIQSFDGYLDGKWVLVEYDPKNKHVWHSFDNDLTKGEHTFKLIVKDWKNNEKVYEEKFVK